MFAAVLKNISGPKEWRANQDYDCEGAPDQINLQFGEYLTELVEDVNGWTKVKNSCKMEGLVKTTMLCK